MDVTELYHCCEGESCSFCECCARNPIDIGWKTSSEDNLSDSNNAATCTKANEESAFIIEILLIVLVSHARPKKGSGQTTDAVCVAEFAVLRINKWCANSNYVSIYATTLC